MVLSLLLLLLLCLLCDGTNQIRLILSPKGQQYGAQLGQEIAEKKVLGLKIPDVDNKDVKVQGLDIVSFKSPEIFFEVQPPNKLAVSTQKGTVRVKGYAMKKDITLIGDVGGSMDITIDTIQVNMALKFTHVDKNLHLELTDCSIRVHIADLQFHGSTAMNALVFILKPLIKWLAPKFASKAVCGEAKKAISTIANQKLPDAMSEIKIKDGVALNLAVQTDPIAYKNGFFEVDVLPILRVSNSTPEFKTPSPDHLAELSGMLESVQNDRMAFILLSDELLNLVSKSAHLAGMSKYILTPETRGNHSFLRATCDFPEVCIGRVFPDLGRLFSNETLAVAVETEKASAFKIVSGKMFFDANVRVKFFDPETNEDAVVLTVGVGGWLSPTVHNNAASIAFNITRLEGHVIKTETAALKDGKLTCALEFIRPIVNSFLHGMTPQSTKLPINFELAAVAVDAALVDNSFKVAADVALNLDKLKL